MESITRYRELYTLQDRVLDVLFQHRTGFYLTGGTCLHRFYMEHRFSDDLDLFTSDTNLFREDVRELVSGLKREAVPFEILVDTRDFTRLIVDQTLKLDLVNDRVYRLGHSLHNPRGIILDNLPNIAANKICAVMGRDEPKDVFDLYAIFSSGSVNWTEVSKAAHQKCVWDMESLEFRLHSFPLPLLDLLEVPDPSFVAEMKDGYPALIDALKSH